MGEFHEMGLEVKKGKMVDATLITSQARPRKKVYIETEPTGDEAQSEESTPTFEATDVTVEESVDQDAHWMKKGNQSTYGYKGHVLTDSNGIVENIIVTPANVHDTVMFPDLIFNTALEEGDIIHADKGFITAKPIRNCSETIIWWIRSCTNASEMKPKMMPTSNATRLFLSIATSSSVPLAR